jgi:hypothetical protein
MKTWSVKIFSFGSCINSSFKQLELGHNEVFPVTSSYIHMDRHSGFIFSNSTFIPQMDIKRLFIYGFMDFYY